jgi:putative intracellular protease/amidase
MTKTALILTTSAASMGDGGKATGFYWEELGEPYWALTDAGYTVQFASVSGGMPPADPGSAAPENRNPAVRRFMENPAAIAALGASLPVAGINGADYNAIFLPGGHGTMWDLAQTPAVGRAVAATFEAGGIVAAVCHGPAGLTEAYLADGTPLVKGRKVSAFTDAEERAAGLEGVVPYLLETKLRAQGALFDANAALFQAHAVRDGRLITGQNPRSTGAVTDLMMTALANLAAARAA